MSTSATGQDVAASYTNELSFQNWLPTNKTSPLNGAWKTTQNPGAGTSNVSGKVSADDVARLINKHSRRVDNALWAAGVQTPFPDISASNPSLPEAVEYVVSRWVAADIRSVLKMGSRGAPNTKTILAEADARFAAIKDNPAAELGKVQVSTPEDFTVAVASSSPQYSESGKMLGIWYRLKNRNVSPKSLVFCRNDGKEAFRSGPLPFIHGVDWAWEDPAEGIIVIGNTEILTAIAQLGAGGGVKYQWGWVRLDRHRLRLPSLRGVSRL